MAVAKRSLVLDLKRRLVDGLQEGRKSLLGRALSSLQARSKIQKLAWILSVQKGPGGKRALLVSGIGLLVKSPLKICKAKTMNRWLFILAFMFFLPSRDLSHGQEKKLEPVILSYSSVTGNRAPLWIAKEMGLYEKYGLNVKLVYIPSSAVSIPALIAGDTHIDTSSGSASVAAAARGAPLVIVASGGPIPFKLVAHPSITSIQELKGKTIGIGRRGTSADYALNRLLPKLGLSAGRDVTIIATGLIEPEKRILAMLQGKMDATLGTTDSVFQFEVLGQMVSVLADLLEKGVYINSTPVTTTRRFLRESPHRVKGFLKAFSEGIWIGKNNREIAYQVFRKYMKIENPKVLEGMHKTYFLGSTPIKPYPREEAIQTDIEDLSSMNPELKGRKASEFMDATLLTEIESEGFFAALQR
jgi:NitT/TauT family transport system substrate-binding protein